MKIKPHKYQINAVKHCLEHAASALFLDLGLGKTVITLTAINNMFKRHEIKGVLVLAPLRVIYNVWPQEVEKWDHLKHLSCGILHGSKKSYTLRENHDIYTINYEGLAWLVEELKGIQLGAWPFDMIVFDESTAVKNNATKRFKMLKIIIKYFKRRIIMTGTPAPNSVLDIWAQYYMLDEGERLGSSYYWYKRSYFYQSDYYGHKWEPLSNSVKVISDKVRSITMRLRAEDYLEMPDLITSQTAWALSPKHQKKYQEFESAFLIEISEEVVTAVNAASLSTKLRQYVSGFLYDENQRVVNVHHEKVDALAEIIEGNPSENVLVAIQFRYEYEMIKTRWKDAPVIFGGVAPQKSKKLISDWNAGQIPLLVVHPASIAHGVNLQHGGRMLVWYGIPWSWEHYSQMVGRLHRQGQEKPVLNTFIVARGTVEEDVIKALETKEENEASFLSNLIKSLGDKHGKKRT